MTSHINPISCHLLMTGNELMSGDTVDTNSGWIASELRKIGLHIDKKVTVGDSLASLEQEIADAISAYDILIINGGLGPTQDDLTAEAVANCCARQLQENAEAREHIEKWCHRRKISANPANLKQALLPTGSRILHNATGSAPGIFITHQECLIFCTPGIPSEMQLMLSNEIVPLLLEQFPNYQRKFIRRLQLFGMGESSVQQMIHDRLPDWPDSVELGFRARFPTLELKLMVQDPAHLAASDQCEQQIRNLLDGLVFGEEDDSLPSVVLNLLTAQHKKLVVAESCTGGLIASQLTAIAGSSSAFEGGFIVYSNRMKTLQLDVPEALLESHGAVSEAVVLAMASGALSRSGADYAIAVSGIAGPDGGTAEKPVGTVCLAWGQLNNLHCGTVYYPGSRTDVQHLVSAYALDLLRRDLLEIPGKPRYLR